jgi:hypothetical protein
MICELLDWRKPNGVLKDMTSPRGRIVVASIESEPLGAKRKKHGSIRTSI